MTLQSDIFLRPVDCARRLSISPESLKKLERAGIVCAYKLPLLEGERRFFWPDVVKGSRTRSGPGWPSAPRSARSRGSEAAAIYEPGARDLLGR